MTLTTRLLLFQLGSLVVVLAGFSAAIYAVAQDHLQRQAQERLEAALNTLTAAVEVTPDGVEWEPNERTLRLSPGAAPDPIAWVVSDETGQLVARSEQLDSDDLLHELAGRFRASTDGSKRLHWKGERWQARQRLIVPIGTAIPHGERPKDPKEIKYQSLLITTALPWEPVRAILRRLLVILIGLSLGILVIAALVGRAVCRRALRPVRRMATDARAIDPNDADRRIVCPQGGDELTDLGWAFNGLLDRFHESSERQHRFAGDASHQLRTPLAALMGQMEIALRRERTVEEYREVLATALAKAARLQRIVEALLYLARANSEAVIPNRERLDLSTWIIEYLATWSNHSRFRDIRIVGVQSPLVAMSHPILLGEIIRNLLDNACQYSAPGREITVTMSRFEQSVQLEVSDRGRGISESDRVHIFTPFFRSTEALRANKSGIGLGLSIARRLAEAVGGSLNLTSRPGFGCCFVFVFQVGIENEKRQDDAMQW